MKKPMYELKYDRFGNCIECREFFDANVPIDEVEAYIRFRNNKRKRIRIFGWLCSIVMTIFIMSVCYSKLNSVEYLASIDSQTLKKVEFTSSFIMFLVFFGISLIATAIARIISNKVISNDDKCK